MNNRITKFLTAIAAFSCAELFAVNVSTVAELTTALSGSDTEIVLASGTYALTSKITVSRAVTIRSATGNPADVMIDGNALSGNQTCTAMVLSNSGIVIDGVTFYRCKAENANGGVRMTAGTIRNCAFKNCCTGGNSGCSGAGVYINGSSAVVSNCVFSGCYVTSTGERSGAAAYVTGGGTLANCLVYGCYRSAYPNAVATLGAVYLAKGTVKNCTIVANTLSDSALYVANDAGAIVKDTISWGNTALREYRDGRPNVTIGGTKATITNLVTENPMLDATDNAYVLMPGSPCIGAGTGGCDIGYRPYDASRSALGIKVGAAKGIGSLTTTVELTSTADINLTGATVTWEGLAETGTSFEHTFGPGRHTLTAHVTPVGGTEMTVTITDAIIVAYTGEVAVSTAADLLAVMDCPSDGLVIKLAEGTYSLNKSLSFYDNVKLIATGERDSTILDFANAVRGVNMGHAQALIAGVKIYRGTSQRDTGGVYIHANGGTVSNCWISTCKAGTNCSIGGVHLNSTGAVVTHSKISGCNCTASNASYNTGGVKLSYGILSDSLIIGNTAGGVAGGVYMDKSTTDAKLVNCTIVGNTSNKSSGGGIYRVNGGGYVYNTIVYGNTSASGEPNIQNGGSDAATRIFCTASDKVFGTDGVALAKAPYTATYELSGEDGTPCIDKGTNSVVVSSGDYFGNARIFQNGIVDIGANEYSVNAIVLGVDASVYELTGAGNITLSATLQGGNIADGTFKWYFDGEASPSATSAEVTRNFSVGRHSVRLEMTYGGTDYVFERESGFITVYPVDIYCDAASENSVWPYSTPGTAATNLNEAVDEALRAGGTLHLAAGLYVVTKEVDVDAGCSITGAGRDVTVIMTTSSGSRRVMKLNGIGALVKGVTLTGGYDIIGSGLWITGDGGTFTEGQVTNCSGAVNQSGGGVTIDSANGVLSRSIIAKCSTHQLNYSDCGGGGIDLSRGTVENCLIISNSATWAGGVYLNGGNGVLRNCTVVGNRACQSTKIYQRGGGVKCGDNPRVENCIIRDNIDALCAAAGYSTDVGGTEARFFNCCIPVEFGSNCVTADPGFHDPAKWDFRISARSPCARLSDSSDWAGLYGDWMEGAKDFFGNPRATGSHKVAIGYFQPCTVETVLMLK